MRLFYCGKDGGDPSYVSGFWLCEFKRLFSIVLLKFEDGSREAAHSHAFNAVSWLLKGRLLEYHRAGGLDRHEPSLRPIITRRETFHTVYSVGTSWVLSFRGPWARTWQEWLFTEHRFVTLAHGRHEVA